MKHIVYLLVFVSILTSCSKEVDVNAPNLKITVDPTVLVKDTLRYKVGDTTKFLMSGTADNVVFYSGELGRNYNNSKRTIASGTVRLNLTSNATGGTQANTLKVYATNKLEAFNYDYIAGVNWTDITGRLALSTGSGAITSSNINVSDIITSPTDSLYIAFKYTGLTGSTQRTWTITNLTVVNELSEGTIVPLLSLATDANWWTKVKSTTSSASWVPSATQLQLVGGVATASSNLSWIVSRPIDVTRINPDVPVVVKHLASELPTFFSFGKNTKGYTYTYTKAGIYQATFLISNNSVNNTKTIIKQFTVKVEL